MKTQALLALAVLASGCGIGLQVLPLNPPERRMRAVFHDQVRMFTRDPDRPFIEVAAIVAEQESIYSGDQKEVLAAVRDKAANLGCDGVIMQFTDRSVNSFYAVEGTIIPSTNTLQGVRAVCIQFRRRREEGNVSQMPLAAD